MVTDASPQRPSVNIVIDVCVAGFMAEADSLLTVSSGASHDRMRNAPAARAMLQTLHSETSVFSSREPPPERYLFILVRYLFILVRYLFILVRAERPGRTGT